MSGYCDLAIGHPLHGPYHDSEYGFPVSDDRQLFERLCLEIFQAGLSWTLVLQKRHRLCQAFDGFAPAVVARYDQAKIDRLLADAGIIRHRGKIVAIIDNARQILALQQSHGSFADWLAAQGALDLPAWVTLFRKTFKFTGGEIVKEFLMSIAVLPGAHRPDCPVALSLAAHATPIS